MPIPFTGLSSVFDRTVFTHKGPIVKQPISILTGIDLAIISPNEILIPSGSLGSSFIGKTVTISGTPSSRNDGTFYIQDVRGSNRLILENANFDISNVSSTVSQIVVLANTLKVKFNAHRTQINVHGTNDTLNPVTALDAFDLSSSIVLINNLKTRYLAHIALVGAPPPVHQVADTVDILYLPNSHDLPSAYLLVNEIRARYEEHRQNRLYHLISDDVNRTLLDPVLVITGSGPNIGPFSWTISDPRLGMVANDSSDVSVLVNSLPASTDAVFGLLGAVVLSTKPGPTDTVSIDYGYLANPPSRLLRLNSPEFALNQDKNHNLVGFPGHKYRARSYLIDPSHSPDLMSAISPRITGWKYKTIERAYTASLNDPNTLLLNVPSNRVFFPVLETTVFEKTIRYDPTTLPQNASDPWTLEGEGVFNLASSGDELTIKDISALSGPSSRPPFFTHKLDLVFPTITSAAFRTNIVSSTPDGVFEGLGFGISNGGKAAIVGFIETNANNLTSAIVLINDIKLKFNSHIIRVGVHVPNDTIDNIEIVDATDLVSLIILANEVKKKHNLHIAKGAGSVHVLVDAVNPITLPDALDLDSVIPLVNDIGDKYNKHRIQLGVHYSNDTKNTVGLVKQVGFLTNRGFPQFEASWNSSAHDWTILTTYRIHQISDSAFNLYLSGGVSPIATANLDELPAASDIDLRIDPLQQVFFGALGKKSVSESKWSFIRTNTNPIDANQVGDNKSVSYSPIVLPELDPVAPWITIGQGGNERLVTNILMLDSTSSAPPPNVSDLGFTSGAYRGFLRYEPILSSFITSSFEFSANVNYYTFSLDNKSSGVFLDDGTFSTHFVFLQYTPTPATVTGSASEPFPIAAGDTLVFSIDDGTQLTATFPTTTSAAIIVVQINAAAGFAFASAVPGPFPSKIKLTSSTAGANSKIRLIGGAAIIKLGLSFGTYFGLDSNPEPKVSWFGENFPDLDTPKWIASGSQLTRMLNRTLRIDDSSTTDFRIYNLTDPLITTPAFNATDDWKFDFKLTVQSYTAGGPILTGLNLKPIGALVSIDEGTSGKNVELYLSIDSFNSPYLNILSYNAGTGALEAKAQYPFTWNDQKSHTFNIFTSKAADLCLILADGLTLGSFAFSSLRAGVSGPSIAFGSGSAPVANGDPRTSKSVVDWQSVCIFRDRNLSDPTAASRRFIGIYKGGSPSLLSSYYVYPVDWMSAHSYRIVRDPTSSVSVFLDGNPTPVLSVSYDSLTLPLSSSSFFIPMTAGENIVAFGSFNPFEIERTSWGPVVYSLGKLTLTDRRIPPHQVNNQHNVVASSDHLRTKKPHGHFGFTVYSGGTPSDEFMTDSSVNAYTNLLEDTPPVPMTQDLESRGGYVKVVTPAESVPSADFVNKKGFLADFENDSVNAVTLSAVQDLNQATTLIINRANDLRLKYTAHLSQILIHPINDGTNTILSGASIDLATAIVLLNEIKTKFNSHLIQPGIHVHDDTLDSVTTPNATDVTTAATLANDLVSKYEIHRHASPYHVTNDITNTIISADATDLASSIILLNELKADYNFHRTQVGVHVINDLLDVVLAPAAVDLPTSMFLANDIRGNLILHVLDPTFHSFIDTEDSVLASPAIDLNSLVFLVNELKANHNGHRTRSRGTTKVHVIDDVVNITVSPSPLETITTLAEEIKTKFNNHRTFIQSSVQVHVQNDTVNSTAVTAAYQYTPPVGFDSESVFRFLNELKSKYDSHLDQLNVHKITDNVFSSTEPNASSITSAITLVNNLKSKFNDHRTGISFHLNEDLIDAVSSSSAVDPISTAIALANDLLDKMNLHFIQGKSHVHPDTDDLVLLSHAIDVTTLITLVNQQKSKYNSHRIRDGIHVQNDTINTVTLSDATDLLTAGQLLNDIRTQFNAHLIQVGVHGSSVFIRLDPPSRVLYNSMKFFKFPSGETGHLAPFSDDETLHIGGIIHGKNQSLIYEGGSMPERVNFISANSEPFTIVGGDNMTVRIDNGSLITVNFLVGDTSVVNVVSRINGTAGIPAGFAQDNNDGRIRLTSPTPGSVSSIIMSGLAATKLGFDIGQVGMFTLTSDDPSAVNVSLLTLGLIDYLRYETIGTGTKTVYKSKTGLTDVTSQTFDATFSIRINSYTTDSFGDTGIYVGFSGIAGPGFTAAVGFELYAGTKYIKITDLAASKTVYKRPFDWGDGNFHTYRFRRDAITGNMILTVIS